MDSNYLKHTVGPVLSSAINSLIAQGVPTDPSQPDPVAYIASYLLHHNKSSKSLDNDRVQSQTTQALRDAISAKKKLLEETKRRVCEQVREQGVRRARNAELRAEESRVKAASPVPVPAPTEVTAPAGQTPPLDEKPVTPVANQDITSDVAPTSGESAI